MRGGATGGIRGVLSLLHVYGRVRLEVLCHEISWTERELRWRPSLAEEGKVLEVECLGRVEDAARFMRHTHLPTSL